MCAATFYVCCYATNAAADAHGLFLAWRSGFGIDSGDTMASGSYHYRGRRRRRQALSALSRISCGLGFHRRGSITVVDRKPYSQCGRCGIDLIRSRRGWRRMRPGELPEGWEERALEPVTLPWVQITLVLLLLLVVPIVALKTLR